LVKLFLYFGVMAGFGLAIYGILILSPLFRFIYSRSSEYSFTIGQFLGAPIYTLKLTLGKIVPWSFAYYTWPVMLLFIVGNVFAVMRKNREIIFLLLIFYLQFIINAVFGRVIYSRYYLVFLPAVVPIASFVLVKITKLVLYWLK